MWNITFEAGSLVVRMDKDEETASRDLLAPFVWDARVNAWRGEALFYRKLIMGLAQRRIPFEDQAKQFNKLDLHFQYHREPFYYQSEALRAWEQNGGLGVVVLPTGAGKSFLAQLAILNKQRSALVVTPTLDLMSQWYIGLQAAFHTSVGLMGGGNYDIQDLTVTTYDSAFMHMDKLGNRFGLLIFDEVHHLPSSSYTLAARHCVAPYRLGLTATPERADMPNADAAYAPLLGPIVYQKSIRELAGENLANYEIVTIPVELTTKEREQYTEARDYYTDFVRMNGIHMNSRTGWGDFLRLCSRSSEGRCALLAHRTQRRITQCCTQKMEKLAELLAMHRNDRTIIFTADNETVYNISRQWLIPAITHQSNIKERHAILEAFNAGKYPVLVTSKVLNEGVDIPEANVAIVLSGSGSVREHVQRLGRVLRARSGKVAILYELIASKTSEESVSERRRQHDAF